MSKFFALFCFCLSFALKAQNEESFRRLPAHINLLNFENFNPKLDGDGSVMLYMSNLARAEGLKMFLVEKRGGQWGKTEIFDQVIDDLKVNTEGGYFLSYKGDVLVFNSKRYGGIGSYDIWISDGHGKNWSKPYNAGKPLNSSANEGDASLSPDGRELYFMRCDDMDLTNASGCHLLVAQRKPNGYFEEPVPLPAPINTGNEQAPLILADNQSLVFASSRPGGKGGLDLYISRKLADGWSEPVAMDFLNTEEDDRYVSIPAKGDIAYFTRKYKAFRNLVMALIPEPLRQFKVFWIEGKLINAGGEPIGDGVVQVKNLTDGSVKLIEAEPSGLFSAILTEGAIYDVGVLNRSGSYTFHSEYHDLTTMENPQKIRKEYQLQPVQQGTTFFSGNITFEPHKATIDPASEMDLRRLVFLMQHNPDIKIKIGVYLNQYRSDSMQSDPDLTEVEIDTLTTTTLVESFDTLESFEIIQKTDSLLKQINQGEMDSLALNTPLLEIVQDTIFSFNVVSRIDTLIQQEIVYTYHNDRTQKQAEAVAAFLISKNAPPDRIVAAGYGPDSMVFNTSEKNYKVQISLFKD